MGSAAATTRQQRPLQLAPTRQSPLQVLPQPSPPSPRRQQHQSLRLASVARANMGRLETAFSLATTFASRTCPAPHSATPTHCHAGKNRLRQRRPAQKRSASNVRGVSGARAGAADLPGATCVSAINREPRCVFLGPSRAQQRQRPPLHPRSARLSRAVAAPQIHPVRVNSCRLACASGPTRRWYATRVLMAAPTLSR